MQRSLFSPDLERLVATVIDVAYALHRDLGPGLLESVYERLLAIALTRRGLRVARQVPIDFTYFGVPFPGGLRLDLLVGQQVIVEVKAVEQLSPIGARQTLTYLRITGLQIGLVINFGGLRFSDAVRRVENYRRSTPAGIERLTSRVSAVEGTEGLEDEPKKN
ncbi:MAG: GxxExxY protein [Gemmatimonadaceae bacterium]|jgi:iron complex transport system substrate-binding protein|nr:GxxExxY protein [Gemmatimonadaceae bacterium]